MHDRFEARRERACHGATALGVRPFFLFFFAVLTAFVPPRFVAAVFDRAMLYPFVLPADTRSCRVTCYFKLLFFSGKFAGKG